MQETLFLGANSRVDTLQTHGIRADLTNQVDRARAIGAPVKIRAFLNSSEISAIVDPSDVEIEDNAIRFGQKSNRRAIAFAGPDAGAILPQISVLDSRAAHKDAIQAFLKAPIASSYQMMSVDIAGRPVAMPIDRILINDSGIFPMGVIGATWDEITDLHIDHPTVTIATRDGALRLTHL